MRQIIEKSCVVLEGSGPPIFHCETGDFGCLAQQGSSCQRTEFVRGDAVSHLLDLRLANGIVSFAVRSTQAGASKKVVSGELSAC